MAEWYQQAALCVLLLQMMKVQRQVQLFLQEGRSDKVYEIDLCEVSAGAFVVNFRYGRRGTALRDGTKTALAVDRAKAEKIFDSLLAEKRGKGYREAGEPAAAGAKTSPRKVAVNPSEANERVRELVPSRSAVACYCDSSRSYR